MNFTIEAYHIRDLGIPFLEFDFTFTEKISITLSQPVTTQDQTIFLETSAQTIHSKELPV